MPDEYAIPAKVLALEIAVRALIKDAFDEPERARVCSRLVQGIDASAVRRVNHGAAPFLEQVVAETEELFRPND